MVIQKINYRDQVRILLVTNMRKGILQPGDSLSLAKIARGLNVSVTPIREALTQLEQSKIVESIPNRGFIIPSLSKVEAINLYELVFTLEALCIEKSQFNTKNIQSLKTQQLKFIGCKEGLQRINADMEFHYLLTSNYNNPLVQQILSEIKTRIFFYEKEFMESTEFVLNSNQHHDNIIECLQNKDKTEAIKILKTNWMQILNHMTI